MQNQFSIQAFKTASTVLISIKNVNMHENNTRNPYYGIMTSSASLLLRYQYQIKTATYNIALTKPLNRQIDRAPRC